MSIGIIGNDNYNKLLSFNKKSKYYDPTIDINLNTQNDSHSILCNHVTQKSSVLDVGFAQGIIGKILKNELNCKVYGIDIDKDAIDIVNSLGCYEKVYNFDIANRTGEEFKLFINDKNKFDYIIFSDVLEHLFDPADVLVFSLQFLKKNGKILISIPNIAHYDIIYGLLNDKFNYSDMGILDNTHLRFFTKNSFAEYIDSINKKYKLSLECELIGQTIIKPYFYNRYKNINDLFLLNPQLLVLQNLFMLSQSDVGTPILNSIIFEQKINLLDKIELIIEKNKRLIDINKYILNKNKNLQNEIQYINLENESKKYELNSILNSKSWKITYPLRKIKKNLKILKLELSYSSDRKQSIMFFVHSWGEKKDTTVGGTTLYVRDLIHKFNKKMHCYVITIINKKYCIVIFEKGKEIIYDLGIFVRVKNFDGYDKNFYTNIKKLLNILNIDIIHINHIIDFPCDIQLLSKEFKTIITLHDYTMICPRYFLVNKENKLCYKYTNCSKCIDITERKNIIRHDACQKLLINSDCIIMPNYSMINEFKKVYKIHNVKIIENGIKVKEYNIFNSNERKNHAYFNIAFVGYVDNHKGGKLIKETIINTTDTSIKYHIFGITNDCELKKDRCNYKFHDRYKRNNIPLLLNKYQIDLVLFLNHCKESFSYVLSEVLLAGIPCLSFDIGAIGDRIKRNNVGWVVPPTEDYNEIIKIINYIKDSGEYETIKNNVLNYNVPEFDDFANKMDKIYEKYNRNAIKDISYQIIYLDENYKKLY